MTAQRLVFTGPREVTVREVAVPEPGPNQVRVRTVASAISAGTEGLLYRGEAPTNMPADETLDAIEGDFSYPLSYGYAAVGRVDAVGDDVSNEVLDRRVFAYTPHESHFLAEPDALVRVPRGVSDREATLFASLETAVTFLLDGEPLLGEHVAVFGQGVVGILTTALLARSPIETLVTFDDYERRRALSRRYGADSSLEARTPKQPEGDGRSAAAPNGSSEHPDRAANQTVERSARAFERVAGGRADLTYEVSGSPAALDDAIATTGFDGRVIVGSWYGTKPTTLSLGGRFHRSRIDVRSSQVSTLAPRHGGRWSRERRTDVTRTWIERLDLEPVLSHSFDIGSAAEAYELLDDRPDEAVQVILTYE